MCGLDLNACEDCRLTSALFAIETLSVIFDVQAPAFIELLQDADVFANCKSWKVRYRAKAQDVFMPLSTSKLYDGYAMIPVFGGGAVQEDFVRPCPASVVIR